MEITDRYCLDGQRLVAVNGADGGHQTQYRTEIESFSKVTSFGQSGVTGGPAYFIVKTRSGVTMEYGFTSDSRIEAQGKTAVRTWALNRMSDTRGNYLSVSYTKNANSGEFYPVRIDYTGNALTSPATPANNAVVLEYANAVQPAYAFFAGSAVTRSVQLTKVRTTAGSNAAMVKEYRLTYEYDSYLAVNKLSSIQECSATGECLAPTSFYWQIGGSSFQDWRSSTAVTGSFVPARPGSNQDSGSFGDVNGDGRADYVVAWNTSGNRGLVTYLAQSDGTFSNMVVSSITGSFIPQNTSSNQDVGSLVDVNGDGLADYVVVWNNGSRRSLAVYLAVGDGTFRDMTVTTMAELFLPSFSGSNQDVGSFADVNGDGLTDYVVSWNNGGSRALAVYLARADGTFSPIRSTNVGGTFLPASSGSAVDSGRLLDVNGDGLADYVVVWNNGGVRGIAAYLGQADGSFTGMKISSLSGSFIPAETGSNQDVGSFADVNGDGLADYAVPFKCGGLRCIAVYMARGDGTFTDMTVTSTPDFFLAESANSNRDSGSWTDVNGDGLSDYVVPWNQNGSRALAVYFGLRNGKLTSLSSTNLSGAFVPTFAGSNRDAGSFADVNGDGHADYVVIWNNGGSRSIVTYSGPAAHSNLLQRVESGIGHSVVIEYKPLTDALVYTKGSGASYPILELKAPIYVVASTAMSTDVGTLSEIRYTYGALRMDLSGRGSLGFAWTESTGPTTNLVTRSHYRQDWPFVGMPSQVTRSLLGQGGLLSETNQSYFCGNVDATSGCPGAPGKIYFPYVRNTLTKTWDLSGTSLPQSATTQTYDCTAVTSTLSCFGNVTEVSQRTLAADSGLPNGYSKTMVNTFDNDAVNWILGRLKRSTVTSVSP